MTIVYGTLPDEPTPPTPAQAEARAEEDTTTPETHEEN